MSADLGKEVPQATPVDSYEQRRILRENANTNGKPGITIYFTPVSAAMHAEACQQGGYDIPQIEVLTDEIASAYHPNGGFLMGMGGAEFYTQMGVSIPEDPSGWKGRRNPILYPYKHVIRIEGTDGRVWQNYDYVPQGKIIESMRPQRPTSLPLPSVGTN